MTPLPQTPLVSIVTPSFNTGRYIAETLRSVQANDYPHLEHIVLDSGSTDETLEVLAQFPTVTVIRDAPAGVCEKVNLGFSMARGQVVAWLCADDYYLPGAIGKAIDALKANPDAALVYCNEVRVDERSVEICRIRSQQAGHRQLVHEQDYLPHPTVFIRREALDAVGLLNVGFPHVCDWDLWIRISRRFALLYVDDWWAAVRKRRGQLSDSHRFTAWLEGRLMARTHGAPFFRRRSWTHRARTMSRLAVMLLTRACRAIDSKLRGIVRGSGEW